MAEPSPGFDSSRLRQLLWPRVRLVGTALGVGLVVGAVAVSGLAAQSGDVLFASDQTFAVAALIFGFGLLGWSGSVFAGGTVESMQKYMETGTDWTERKSRRAMARIGGFGAGMMAGVVAGSVALGV